MEDDHLNKTQIGNQLQSNIFYKLGEITLVFLSAFIVIKVFEPLTHDKPIMKQIVIWSANILMLFIVWMGIKLRGEKLQNFGLTFKKVSWKECMKVIALSLLVFVLVVVGYILGSIIMANITGIPENSDLSGYDYLKGNIGMFLLTLGGIYLVSSFGEEFIYRAFLINRITQMGLPPRMGRVLAIILSSIIFGLAHFEWGPMGIVQTGFMGLVLGICYIKLKNRLWILILAHAYMDTILMLQLF